MAIFKNLSLPLTVLFIIVFGWALEQSISDKKSGPQVEIISPWDGLSGAEYAQAAMLLKQAYGDDVLFARISLRQPDKAQALAWQEARARAARCRSQFSGQWQAASGACGFNSPGDCVR